MDVRRIFACVTIATIAGCAGGGGSTPPAGHGGSTGPSGPATAAVPFSITIPQASAIAKMRRPAFISPATQSIAVTVYPAGTAEPTTPTLSANVVAGSNGCALNAAGTALTCTLSVTAPIGSDSFAIKTFAGQNGTGAVLANANLPVTVTSGMPAIQFILSGTPQIVRLSLETPVLPAGTSGTSVLDVNAYDPSGALIVAPGLFSSPLTISSDSSAVSLSATTATTPGTQITVSYSGGAAPYAVHLTATGTGVSAANTVNATLDITPSQSIAVLGGYSESPFSIATIGINAVNEPPQSFVSLPTFETSPASLPGFAAFGNGTIAIGALNTSSGVVCDIGVYPGGSPTPYVQTLTPSTDGDYCPIAAEPNGDLLAASNGGGGSELAEYSIGATSLTPTGNAIPLVGAFIPTASVGAVATATNANGNIAILAYTGSSYYALEYTSITSGASGPQTQIALPTLSGPPIAIAIAADGSMAVLYQFSSSASYQINRYTTGGTLAGSISPSNATYSVEEPWGIAIDAAGDMLVLASDFNSTYSSGEIGIDVFPGGTFGTIVPQRTIPLSLAAGIEQAEGGPQIVASPAPPATSAPVSGDMLGYVASRTWIYLMTPSGGTPYYVGVYAEPQLVNGNLRLIGYQSSTSNPFSGGTIIGSVDFTPLNGSYLAYGFDSVSSGTSGTSGTIPGTPLFVPSSLALNEVWNPLQNQTILNAVGASASAQVVAVGPASTACPSGGSTNGATVQYSFSQASSNFGSMARITYVPGCGITGLLTQDGTTGVLQSVGSMPSLGQVAVPAGQPAIVQALHAIWQKTFNVHPPKN
jgi:hypothetical protein